MKTIQPSASQAANPYISLVGMTVFDRNGNKASIRSIYKSGDNTMAVLAKEDGSIMETELSSLERHEGAFFIPLLRTEQDARVPSMEEWHEEMKIPVTKEEISITQHRIDTGKGIRVKKHVLEHDEIVDVPHAEEKLSVKHIEVGTILSEGSLPQPRQEGDTYIIPVFEEVYVIEKRVRLKEEVHITKERMESKEKQKLRLRSEHVAIERFDEGHPPE